MSAAPSLSERMQALLVTEPGLSADPAKLARRIRAEAGVISDAAVMSLLRELRNDTTGLGILESVLALKDVTDVVVNGPSAVFFDRGKGLEKSNVRFENEEQVRRLATRLAISAGGRLDDAAPFADGRLPRPDGSAVRIHALLSPPAAGGTCLSIRVLRQARTRFADLVAADSVAPEIERVLRGLIEKRVSFLIIGGTGTGKTTLLSALLALCQPQERVITIEDTAELAPEHPHVVQLVSRRANAEGRGEITLANLLRQALRMRPDRIVVGEIRGAEVVDLLAALNTGHDGGAGTLHANSLEEVPARMEALAALGGLDRLALHSQLAAAVNVVIALARDSQGKRFVSQVGLLNGNPVRAHIAWSRACGPGESWPELLTVAGVAE